MNNTNPAQIINSIFYGEKRQQLVKTENYMLALASKILKEEVMAGTFVSPIFPQTDLVRAKNLVKKLGVEHVVIPFDILSHEGFLKNDGMRCHFCKIKMIEELNRVEKRRLKRPKASQR